MFLHLCASDLELDCSGSLRLFGKLVPPARSFLVVDCFFPTGVAEAPTGVGGLARECAAPSCPGPTPADGGAGAATLREHPAQCKQVGPGVLLGTLWGAAPTSGDSEAKPMASLLLAASRNSPSSLAPTCRLRVRAPLTRHWRLPEQPGAYEALMLRRYAPGGPGFRSRGGTESKGKRAGPLGVRRAKPLIGDRSQGQARKEAFRVPS
eukprot:GHVT01079426.1.p1 GENE.GHVT01079426.1~~GHVT01079426.1.p1  ORF type:complete len:208 (-),score=43.21 GHVT01079426.1:1920-2543(-)